MAGVGEDRTDNSQQGRLDDFAYYSKAVRCIFENDNYWSDWKNDEIKNKPGTIEEIKSASGCSFDNLFHRVMLTKGLYWSDVAKGNGIKTFFVYNEKHNNYDWRGAFRQSLPDDRTCNDGWGEAVECLHKLLDDYSPLDRNDRDYKFDFAGFKMWIAKRLTKVPVDPQTSEEMSEETARLRSLLIENPDCFKYIRNNYYIYRDDATPEYLLMSLKRKRDGSFINITDELTKQGETS